MSEITEDRPAAGMPCPRCRVDLVMSERQGIEIDYCPSCRGVWLDRGELDKIIERNAAFQMAAPPQAPPLSAAQPSPWLAAGQPLPAYPPAPQAGPEQPGWGWGHDFHDREDRHGTDDGRRRGHGSFLGRLFDR